VIDSQSVNTTESGGPRGYDAGKKGQRAQAPHHHRDHRAASRRPGAPRRDPGSGRRGSAYWLRSAISSPWLRHVFADDGYAGEKLETILAGMAQWTLAIVKRPDQARGFCLLPRRWVVERTFAWLGRNRRLAKDFEATIGSAEPGCMWPRSSSWRGRLARRSATAGMLAASGAIIVSNKAL
jgi:transposase